MPNQSVTGLPRALLQLEGAALLAVSVVAYHAIGGLWLWFAVLFLLPDITMLGYLAGPRWGALVYNLGHTTLLPAALGGWGWLIGGQPLAVDVALIWLAHIGFDRAVGYGLKYPDAFRHTHLMS
jgi:hypothetical protein